MRLLDRQVSLLEYLTSRGAIFGGERDASLDQGLQGLDRGLLRLEACFSHEKRMSKIGSVFPRTLQLLGTDQAAIVREFVEACPPADISRLENARQLYDFLCARWDREPPQPPYLRDVAACEFSCAKLRVGAEAEESQSAGREQAPRNSIRRHPGVVLLRCTYDVRAIFEDGAEDAVPVKRDTPVAVVLPTGAEHPRVFEVLPLVFDVLTALDDWTDRSSLGAAPELEALIHDLAEHGLVEVRR
jgi:hypothetical protein